MRQLADWAGSTGWMTRGACHAEDPELFFPIAETRAAEQQIRTAKMVCARCGVSALCLAYALDSEYEGIWGGTTRQERVAARRCSGTQPRTLQRR